MRNHWRASNSKKGKHCYQNLTKSIIKRAEASRGKMHLLLRMRKGAKSSPRKQLSRSSRIYWISTSQGNNRTLLPGPIVVGWDHITLSSWRVVNRREGRDFHSQHWVMVQSSQYFSTFCVGTRLLPDHRYFIRLGSEVKCSEQSTELPFRGHGVWTRSEALLL